MTNIERNRIGMGTGEERNDLAFMEKKKIEEMNNKLKLENRVKNTIFSKNNLSSPQSQKLLAENSSPKRSENDSRFTNFVRGFRREQTDFFPSAKQRHSAIFGEQNSPLKNNAPQKVQRSSAIFQRNRPKGEPVLTDFIPKRDNTLEARASNSKIKNNNISPGEVKLRNPSNANNSNSSNNNNSNMDYHRMRREKTESVIFVSRNAHSSAEAFQQQLQQQQQVKAKQKRDFLF
jgi:TRAF2 and NCK interacting kinase